MYLFPSILSPFVANICQIQIPDPKDQLKRFSKLTMTTMRMKLSVTNYAPSLLGAIAPKTRINIHIQVCINNHSSEIINEETIYLERSS